MNEVLKTSRPILLGSRDPRGQSCVTVIKTGEVNNAVPSNPGDWNGGPGTTMATLYYFDRQNNKSPMQDFNWHQTRLKTYLQNESASNEVAAGIAHDLAEQSMRFYETTEAWANVPADLAPIRLYARMVNGQAIALPLLDRADSGTRSGTIPPLGRRTGRSDFLAG